jgi:hypothetical protein
MLWPKILAGAVVGAFGGYLMSRSPACGSGKCATRPPRIATILAAAVFGAAIAAYWTR